MAGKVTQWQCRVEAEGEITVGRPFILSCSGEANQLSRDQLNLRRPKDNPYALRILKIEELQSSNLRILATTYVAGENSHEVYGYAVTDGDNTIEFVPFKIDSKSVITQENNPEGKPFGPFKPVEISYPLWIWIAAAVFAAFLLSVIGRIIYLGHQRKQFLRELNERSTSLGPYHQLQKDLRQITRTLPVSNQALWTREKAAESIQNLETAYSWFLAREFKIPAHKWSAKLVFREIKKIDRKLFKHVELQLRVAGRELRRAKRNAEQNSVGDFQQLLEIVRKAADVIHLHRNQESRR
jgi:hypothetical protein